MFKLAWSEHEDPNKRKFVLVPDAETLFDLYWVFTGYGRGDGCAPMDIKASNLDGDLIDMQQGLADVYAMGSYSK